jgi:hypothetical protein
MLVHIDEFYMLIFNADMKMSHLLLYLICSQTLMILVLCSLRLKRKWTNEQEMSSLRGKSM